MSRAIVPSLWCILAMIPAAALAQTVPLMQDTYVVPGNGSNYGAAVTINVGGPGGDNGLVQFDLSTLPSGVTVSNIAKATLALYVNKLVAAGSMNISEANGPWSELAANGNTSVVAGAAVASGVSVPAADVYIYVDATQAVKDWLGGTTNSGFFIAPNGGGVNAAFDSKESTTTSHPATLSVTLMSMGPAGATGAQGPTGANGANGANGAAGATGAQGPTGPTGAAAAGGCSAAQSALLQCWSSSGSYAVGAGPAAVAFDGANIWVAKYRSNNVTKLLASTGAVLGTYNVGTYPYGVAFDGANIWVANNGSNNVTKLLASTGAVLGTYDVGTGPSGVAFDGANIWVANYVSNNVTKLLASTGAVLGTYDVGTGPSGVAFDGANIWVPNQLSNNVTKLQASTGTVLATTSVGINPSGVAFDGANIWVPNQGSNTVTKLLASTGAVLGTYGAGTNPRAWHSTAPISG